MTIDSRKIGEIEEAAEEQEKMSKKLSRAHDALEEASDTLLSVMEKHKVEVYTRVPWGTVSIKRPEPGKKRVTFRRLTQKSPAPKDISDQEE